jgi:hypothetical protein
VNREVRWTWDDRLGLEMPCRSNPRHGCLASSNKYLIAQYANVIINNFLIIFFQHILSFDKNFNRLQSMGVSETTCLIHGKKGKHLVKMKLAFCSTCYLFVCLACCTDV